MTIDEKIQDFRQLEYDFEHSMCDTEDDKENLMKYQQEYEYYKQLADWLEELKMLRVIFGKIIRDIEELQNYACFPTEWVSCEQSEVHTFYAKELTKILKLAEQLKEGGTDA